MFRYIVLGLLRDATAQHGYGIMKAYRSRSGLTVNSGTVYRELRRLQAGGLIHPVPNPTGRRSRSVSYEISVAGRASFDVWLAAPLAKAIRPDSGLVRRAMFLTVAGDASASALLKSWHQELWFQSKSVERAHRVATESGEAHSNVSFSPLPLLLARRLRYVTAEIEFLEELKAAYEDWKAQASRAKAAPNTRRATARGGAVRGVGRTSPEPSLPAAARVKPRPPASAGSNRPRVGGAGGRSVSRNVARS